MKVEMIELHEINAVGIGRSDILEVKQEHLEQYKSFYNSFAQMNLENMLQDKSLLKLMQLKLKNQVSKLTERIKLYSNKLGLSRIELKNNTFASITIHAIKEVWTVEEKKIRDATNLDKDTNAFWRSKVKELVKERQLLKNYLKVLNKFHSNLKKSIYDLEKDIYMKQEENKPND